MNKRKIQEIAFGVVAVPVVLGIVVVAAYGGHPESAWWVCDVFGFTEVCR